MDRQSLKGGERLYELAKELDAQRKLRVQQIKQEREQAETEGLTFQPRITALAKAKKIKGYDIYSASQEWVNNLRCCCCVGEWPCECYPLCVCVCVCCIAKRWAARLQDAHNRKDEKEAGEDQ